MSCMWSVLRWCQVSMSRRLSAMISSMVWTTESGGRPPSFFDRSMLPREATKRMPSLSAASICRAIRSPAPWGKT